MTRLVTLLFLTAAACGGSSKPVTAPTAKTGNEPIVDPIPQTPGPNCTIVADKLAIVALADEPNEQPAFKALVEKHCNQDKWSDEVRNCFATVETDDEAQGCRGKLTAAQLDSISNAAKDQDKAGSPPRTMAAPPAEGAKGTGTKSKTRGAPSKTSSDPCEGGEGKADPCEGGQ